MDIYTEWANYRNLLNPNFFVHSKLLYDTETNLSSLPFCTKWSTPYTRDSLHWSRRFEYPWILEQIAPPNKDDMFMDAGAGTTPLQFFLCDYVKEYHSLDFDQEAFAFLNNMKNYGIAHHLVPVLADVTDLSMYPDDFFNNSISVSVLEHMSDSDITRAVEEQLRVTKETCLVTMDMVIDQTTDSPIHGDGLGIFKNGLPSILDSMIDLPPLPSDAIRVVLDNKALAVICIQLKK